MGKKIQQNEIAKEIRKLENGKSVGGDGISAETIKANQEWATPILQQMYNQSAHSNDMPKEWAKGVTTFIRTKNETDNLGNYRPLTLINIVYKIWASLMSTGLNPFPSLLTSGNHYARKSKRPTIDILSMENNQMRNDETKQLILIDFAKAFDSFGRDILWVKL